MRRPGGFTLIEMLAVLALLGILTLLMARMLVESRRVLSGARERTTRLVEASAAQRFLRNTIGLALPLPLNEAKRAAPCFIGDSESMQFVAPLPDVVGGGIYLQKVSARAGGLWLDFANHGLNLRKPALPPTLLLDHVERVRFAYEGVSDQGVPSGWLDAWPWPNRLPEAVRISVRTTRQDEWTTQVVQLRLQLASEGPA